MAKSLFDALHEKYGDDDDDQGGFVHIVVGKRPRHKSETGDILVPPLLSMENLNISCCGSVDAMKQICSQVTELGLMDNCIREWAEVRSFLQCMPHIHFLHLAGNPLGQSSSELTSEGIEENQIKHAVFNNTQITWEAVGCILSVLKNLEELHLSLNNFTNIAADDLPTCPSIQRLYLNENAITDWSHVNKLGKVFPNMKHLVLIGNPLETIEYDESLANIEMLNLSGTKLKDWSEIEKLRKFPCLKAVRLRKIPFLEQFEEQKRWELLIVYLPNIEQLNGSPVNEVEREKAERAFVRMHMDQEEKPSRYAELEQTYGRLEHLAEIDLTPPDEARLEVLFEEEKPFTHTTKIHVKVQELKKALAVKVDNPVNKLRFFHRHKDDDWWTDLRYPEKKLYTVPISDGDSIMIQMK